MNKYNDTMNILTEELDDIKQKYKIKETVVSNGNVNSQKR